MNFLQMICAMRLSSRQLLFVFSLGILMVPGFLGWWMVVSFVQRVGEKEQRIADRFVEVDLQEIVLRTHRQHEVDNLLFHFPTDHTLFGATAHNLSPTREVALEMQRSQHESLDGWLPLQPRTTDSLLHAAFVADHLPIAYELRWEHLYEGRTLFVAHHTYRRWWLLSAHPRLAASDTLYLDNDHLRAYVLRRESVVPLVLQEMWPVGLLFGLLLGAGIWLIRLLMLRRQLEATARDFTHNITHELKTPIAVALAAHESLADFGGDLDPVRRRHLLATSRRQLQRLAAMVEQLLAVSRPAFAPAGLHLTVVDLLPLLHRLQDEHELKATKPVSIFVQVVPEGLTVRADADHLTHVLSNLIDNAVKYSPEQAEVDLLVERDKARRRIVFSVTDRGIGIPARYRERVFRKFFRVPQGDRHEVRGYGLGLFYVRSLVELHGGRIGIVPTASGTTVRFWLPDA